MDIVTWAARLPNGTIITGEAVDPDADIANEIERLRDQRDEAQAEVARLRAIASEALAYESPHSYDTEADDILGVWDIALARIAGDNSGQDAAGAGPVPGVENLEAQR